MSDYWENRYKSGGNSGSGSYNEDAKFKANTINDYILKYGIKTISDFGCGDGNQISFLTGFDEYMGYDVSSYALYLCHEKFKGNKKMNFCSLISDLPEADLCMSLDVLYHIVDETEFGFYLYELFNKSKKYVLIYSSNRNSPNDNNSYCCHRIFTEWVEKNYKNFKLIEAEKYLHPSVKVYLYEKII